MTSSLLPADYYYLAFPALLFVYYLISWLLAGRDPRVEGVAPQYEPPAGITPGVARYILTGGSDGTTLAAVAAALAAKGVVSIEPAPGEYRLTLLETKSRVAPEEAALVKELFNVELEAEPYAASKTAFVGDASQLGQGKLSDVNLIFGSKNPSGQSDAVFGDDIAESSVGVAAARLGPSTSQAVICPAAGAEIKNHIDAIQNTFSKNLRGVYFRQNFIFSGIGMLATLICALAAALTLETQSSLFLTFWLLMFTSISGLVIGGVWTSKPARPTMRQRIIRILLPVLFVGLPGSMIYFVAMPNDRGFVLALLLSVLLNSVFFYIMRAPTPLGQTALRQLAGFREFLVRVEQDRLARVNTPAQRAELMDRFLPYAIALGVREGWGDTMAAAFSDAIER
jgi:hypothetical protein